MATRINKFPSTFPIRRSVTRNYFPAIAHIAHPSPRDEASYEWRCCRFDRNLPRFVIRLERGPVIVDFAAWIWQLRFRVCLAVDGGIVTMNCVGFVVAKREKRQGCCRFLRTGKVSQIILVYFGGEALFVFLFRFFSALNGTGRWTIRIVPCSSYAECFSPWILLEISIFCFLVNTYCCHNSIIHAKIW